MDSYWARGGCRRVSNTCVQIANTLGWVGRGRGDSRSAVPAQGQGVRGTLGGGTRPASNGFMNTWYANTPHVRRALFPACVQGQDRADTKNQPLPSVSTSTHLGITGPVGPWGSPFACIHGGTSVSVDTQNVCPQRLLTRWGRAAGKGTHQSHFRWNRGDGPREGQDQYPG